MPQTVDWYGIQKIINNSTLSEERKEQYMYRLMVLEDQENEFAQDEIKEIITIFYQSAGDPILNGTNYNMTDIKNHLRKLR